MENPHGIDVTTLFQGIDPAAFLPGRDKIKIDSNNPDSAVRTFADETGMTLSAISDRGFMTWFVNAIMPLDGLHVFEIGTGTGFLAYALGQLTGSSGTVAGCELIPDLFKASIANPLISAMPWIKIHQGDFTQVLPELGVFDVVIATSSMSCLPPALSAACRADGGRIALPIQIRGGGDCFTIFERHGTCLETVDSLLSVSVPTMGSYTCDSPWAAPVRVLLPGFDLDEAIQIARSNELGHQVYDTLGLRSFLQAFEPCYVAVEIGTDRRLSAQNMAYGLIESDSYCLQQSDRLLVGGSEGLVLAERFSERCKEWVADGRPSLCDYRYRIEIDDVAGNSFASALADRSSFRRRR